MNGGPLTRFGISVESREERREKVLAGVIGTVYRQVPLSVLGSIVGGVAVVAVFWNTHSQNLLIIWFLAMLCESLIRLRVARAFQTIGGNAARIATWSRRWIVLAAAAGALWGAAGFLFFAPQSPLLQLVLIAVILGVAFGSLTLYASHGPALFAFLPLALLPLTARMIIEQDPAYYTAAIVVVAVFAFTMFIGRNFGEAMHESVKNNYENEVLVGQLVAEKRVADDARRDAETANRSKTQFFAAASHDLRQPLQAIGIYCSLLRKRAQGPLEPLVNNLSTAVSSLSKLVEELLEISRLDSGSIQPRVEQVSVADMFGALEQEFTAQAAAKGLELRVRRPPLAVDTDVMLLQRVLRNLIANAIRYTAKGGILISARRRKGAISLEVWDTGPGIRQAELDRVFEEFYRGESSKGESSGGFGLGLSIVKRICMVLGHPLIVTTRPGTGTVFRVEVPPTAAPALAKKGMVEPIEMEMRAINGQTIVVLEDNEEILNSLTRLLRSWGADILSSTSFNGSLVKRVGSRPRIDLLIADQNLGNAVSGVEAAFRVRELVGKPIPIVMLTAVQASEVQSEFQRLMQQRLQARPQLASAIARSRVEEPIVLQKPTTAAVLNATICNALGLTTIPNITTKGPVVESVESVAEGEEERVKEAQLAALPRTA